MNPFFAFCLFAILSTTGLCLWMFLRPPSHTFHPVKHILKWTLLVWLNAAVSLVLAADFMKEWLDALGVILGIFTFVGFYSLLDYRLLQAKATRMRRLLLISVLIKALTQVFPIIEMFSGMIAASIVQQIFGPVPFIRTYFTTVIDGVLLSVIVGIFMLIIRAIGALIARIKAH